MILNYVAGVYCNKTDLPDTPSPGYRVRHLPAPSEYMKKNIKFLKMYCIRLRNVHKRALLQESNTACVRLSPLHVMRRFPPNLGFANQPDTVLTALLTT